MLWELEKEKRILAKTYHDRMDVYRKKYTEDLESGESILSESLVYQDLPCALVVSDNGAAEKGEAVDTLSQEQVIFAGPEAQLHANDRVVIRVESGQVYEGKSGRTYVVRNHGETAFKVDRTV